MSEGTVRVARTSGYTVVQNRAVRDPRLSLEASGLYVRLMSLPDNKPHTFKYVQKVAGCGRDKLRRCFNELEAAGYLVREQKHEEHGKFGTNDYALYDEPISPSTGFPSTVNPTTAEPSTVEPTTAEPSPENPSTKELTKERNKPPISPKGDSRAESKSICQWNEARFLRFWEYYRTVFCASDHSRAGERAAAASAWDKLKPDDEMLAKLSRKLTAIMSTRQWQDGIGIPMASTLLNRVRLGKTSLDELPEPSAAPHFRCEAPVREEDQWIT